MISNKNRTPQNMSNNPRHDAAWRIVRDHGDDWTDAEISGATGVGRLTVARMRSRATEFAEAPEDITGRWNRDKPQPVTTPVEP